MSARMSQGPKLFINQKFVRPPSNITMQEVYTNRHELQSLEDEPPVLEEFNQPSPPVKEEMIPEDRSKLAKLEVDSAAKPKRVQQSSLRKVKPFKELTLPERLDYLINFPKVLPPVPCLFYTAEENFQGYLTEYTDQHVMIRLHDQTAKTIPLEQLTNVIMIGIRS